jgi:glycosyltransferase involved in cell wall biosynthesis
VFVVGSLRRGGAERQLVALAGALRSRGWTVWILCLEETGNEAWVAHLRNAGVRFEELHLGRITRRGKRWWQLRRIAHAYAFLRRVRPDVVYCLMWWSYILLVPVAKAARVPVVVTCRQSLSDTEGARRAFRPVHMLVDRLADAVVCVSEATRDDAIANVRTPTRKIVVIPNGVPFPSTPPPPPRGEPVAILTIANLHPYKGHHVLLKAFSLVRGCVGPGRVRLDLAGEGVERDRLIAYAEELEIRDDVRFLGTVEDVDAVIASAAFSVLPSFSEGLPLSVLESLALGRPVVASRVGGVPEILDHGGGVMVPPGDAEALAAAMVDLVADPDRREELGREGRQVVRERFSIDAIAGRTVALFDLISQRKGKG